MVRKSKTTEKKVEAEVPKEAGKKKARKTGEVSFRGYSKKVAKQNGLKNYSDESQKIIDGILKQAAKDAVDRVVEGLRSSKKTEKAMLKPKHARSQWISEAGKHGVRDALVQGAISHSDGVTKVYFHKEEETNPEK
jgi:hypothetical protein